MAGRVHIGTSGWSYSHWRGPFYPKGLVQREWLPYYAARFESAEINASFYRLPSAETLEAWRDAVPDRFVFAVKASRYITHMKKLREPDASVRQFVDRISLIGDRLGPILFQLPPRWRVNIERLSSFLATLSVGYRYAFEFRDDSWFRPDVFDLLKARGAALCLYELAGRRTPDEVTADFVYIRLHGPGDAYQGRYTTDALRRWAEAIDAWRRSGKDVFCYFDNDQAGYAPINATELVGLVISRRR